MTLKRSGSLFGSEPVRVTVLVVSWLSDTDWALATGGSFTVMDTVADAVPPLPSLIEYVKESGPEYPVVGVYVTELPALTTAVPCAGTDAPVTVSGSLSGSLSLTSTLTVTAVSCRVVAESLFATGGWLTWLTVIDTIAA